MTEFSLKQILAKSVVTAALFFTYFGISSYGTFEIFDSRNTNSYIRMAESFRNGSVSFLGLAKQEEAIATFKDPYSPYENWNLLMTSDLHDASYFKGKFFSYYGAAAAFLIYMPFNELTGRYPSFALVVSLLLSGLAWLTLEIFKLFLDQSKVKLSKLEFYALCSFLLFSNTNLAMATRPEKYEVAIASGALVLAILIFLISKSLQNIAVRKKASCFTFFGCGVLAGLILWTRPNLIFCAIYLLFIFLFAAIRLKKHINFGEISALVIGLLISASSSFWFNYARFDNPIEFGTKYILNSIENKNIFSKDDLPSLFLGNSYLYLAGTIKTRTSFPFVDYSKLTPGDVVWPSFLVDRPKSFIGEGVIPFFQVAPLGIYTGFLLILLISRRALSNSTNLFLLGSIGGSLLIMIPIFSLIGSSLRYTSDFSTLTSLAIAAIAAESIGRGVVYTKIISFFLVGIGIAVSFLAPFSVYDFLILKSPNLKFIESIFPDFSFG